MRGGGEMETLVIKCWALVCDGEGRIFGVDVVSWEGQKSGNKFKHRVKSGRELTAYRKA